MKKILLSLFVSLTLSAVHASEDLVNACVRYQRSDSSWSKEYQVKGYIFNSSELEAFAKSRGNSKNYGYGNFYVIPWKEGGYTVLKITNNSLIYDENTEDQRGVHWKVKKAYGSCTGEEIPPEVFGVYDPSNYEGWTLIWSGRVTGYQDSGGKSDDAFEGCDYDRKIFLDNQYQVVCRCYGYTYGYYPQAVLLHKGGWLKLIVNNHEFNVSKY